MALAESRHPVYKASMKAPPYTADRRIDLTPGQSTGVVLALLAGSLLLIAIAPVFVPDSYDWVKHTTSESAGQGVDNAWIARLGFVLFGFAVLILAPLAGRRWGLLGRLAHRGFGIGMILTAVFASKPWGTVPFVEFEDTLHSWASGLVGMAFIGGVTLVLLRRPIASHAAIVFDWLALMVAVVMTILVFVLDDVAGLAQRAMFLTAYVWYAMESIRSSRFEPHGSEAMAERMAA